MTSRSSLIFFAFPAAAAVVTMTIAGCSPGPLSAPKQARPMNKPVALNSDDSSGTLEAARRQLTGTWDLEALEYSPQGNDTRVPVKASGTLVYDEFGNLTIDARTTDPAAPVAAREANILAFKGRAVIDVTRSELKLMDLTGNVDPNEVLAPERRRKYELHENTLMLSSFNDRGQVTAISTWKRRS
jgi:hypothetical protein